MGLAEGLAGAHLLLTGTTGFVGQALLERVLADLPQTRVTLLIRGSAGQGAEDRAAELLARWAFDPLRRRLGDAGFAAAVATRVTVLEADLARPLPPLPGDVDAVVHCAGEVSFDMALDDAFRANLAGATTLLDALAAAGSHPHVVHVSTAYVAGLGTGPVLEQGLQHDIDWRVEAAAADALRERTETDSRTPHRLRQLLAEGRRSTGGAGPLAAAEEAERARAEWVRESMVEAGRARATSLGWTDAYTFTKALTERAVEEHCAAAGVALTVVRPTIIESALERPSPGWIEGFKVAEPIILAYGRGDLADFPAAPDAALDVVPVDHVVAACLAAVGNPPPLGEPSYLHVGTSARNPLRFEELYLHVRTYFSAHPLPVRDRGHVLPPGWSFASPSALERRIRVATRAQCLADRALGVLPPGERVRALAERVDRAGKRLGSVRRLAELYRGYTQAEVIFDDARAAALNASLSPADQRAFSFDPTAVDWRHYLVDLHCPTVSFGLRWRLAEPTRPALTPSPVVGRGGGGQERRGSAQPVAAFDMDGTLLASTVVEAYLWARLADVPRSRRPRELAELAVRLPGLIAADRRSRGAVVRAVALRYAGADPEALARLVDTEVASAVLRRLSAAAVRVVREHRAAGHRTVLVTGGLDVFTRPLAPLFDEVCAARLAVGADGRATGRLVEPPVVAEARAAWLRRRALVEGWHLASSSAYADSASDVPLLRAVGTPVAVNPDVVLARTAKREGWPVVRWAPTPGAGASLVASGADR